MFAESRRQTKYKLMILFAILSLTFAACGPNSARTARSDEAAPATASEDAAATSDSNGAVTSSAKTMMHGSDESMRGMMGSGEHMGHNHEAMPHTEGEAGHEDMAAAHGVPEEYAAMENPVEATDSSIARGAELFQANCAVCHGVTGQGDGVAAAGLTPKPANLSDDHVRGNPDGALFYTISKGVPGTAMVAWESQIAEQDRWHLVNFIRTIQPE